jgi:succinyl-diaminopimelate desuccinylase
MLDVVDLLEELVRIESVNPAMGGGGEASLASFLADVLRGIGADVSLDEVEPGRPNVVGVLAGTTDPAILLEAHLDTVALPEVGLEVRRARDRVVGRGSCDTKGSCAAMVAALDALSREPRRPTVVFAGAMDEEASMLGSRALVERLPPVGGAVVGEPTSLAPIRVHNGLARIRLQARGVSAHTSRAHLGVNAISAAAQAITALDRELVPRLHERSHPMAGPALLTAAVIQGGIAPNVVPERCEIVLDRRIAPGEEPERAMKEIDEVLERVREAGHDVVREDPYLLLPAVETPADHPLVGAAEEAVEAVLGRSEPAGGVPYGTDASNLSGLGRIPCVVLGPGTIDEAHSDHEWVPIVEVEQAVAIYVETAHRFARRTTGATT